MIDIPNIVLLKLITKPTLRRHTFIYRPTRCKISRSANIEIKTKFHFNRPRIIMIGQKNYLGELIIDDNATFTIDSFSFYQGCCLNVSANAKFSALSGFINSYSKITCTNSITVGEDVFIGNNVTIIDTDFHTIFGSIKSAPINIGNHV